MKPNSNVLVNKQLLKHSKCTVRGEAYFISLLHNGARMAEDNTLEEGSFSKLIDSLVTLYAPITVKVNDTNTQQRCKVMKSYQVFCV